MTAAPSRKNQMTLHRAVRAADRSLVPRVVEVDVNGTIRLVPLDPAPRSAIVPPARQGDANEWDEVLS